MTYTLQSVINYYDDCAMLIKDDAKSMGWSSLFNQQLRFDVINFFVDLSNQSLLDIGCGDGGLFHYLKDQQINCDYKGIDISPKMIHRAQARFPGINVRQANFFDITQTFDVVIASGSLSMATSHDPMLFLTRSIDHLFSITHNHLVFNLLSTNAPRKSAKFNRYQPEEVISYCFKKTPYVSMHHGYLPNDFTVHMAKP